MSRSINVLGLADPSQDGNTIGECMYTSNGTMKIWDGNHWIDVCIKTNPTPTEVYASAMEEEFKQFPALKDAFEQYLLIQKMVDENG